MKKNLAVFLLAFAIVSNMSCGSKSEKDSEELTEAAATEDVMSDEEKDAISEKEHDELAAKRKAEFEKQAKISLTYKDKDGNIVYNKAEVDPTFDGGNKAMRKYLRDNLVFPQAAQDSGLEGSVFVDFVVTKSGSVREVEITEETSKLVDQTLRDEAVRVVKSMPKWLPGRQHGDAVDTKFSIPISFRLI